MTPPGRAESTDEVVVNDQKNLGHIEAGAESTIDELIGRRKAGEDGVEPTPLAHAPEFTKVSSSSLSSSHQSLICASSRIVNRHGTFSSEITNSIESSSRRRSLPTWESITSVRSGLRSKRRLDPVSTLSKHM